MTTEFSNKTTFASVDLRKASTVKTNRSSELYAGDLAIANAIILGVFAHEKANKLIVKAFKALAESGRSG